MARMFERFTYSEDGYTVYDYRGGPFGKDWIGWGKAQFIGHCGHYFRFIRIGSATFGWYPND